MGENITDILTGEPIKEFKYIAQNLISVLRPNITQDTIKHFLQTKQSYMIDRPPERRMDFNWTTISDRYIKWQMDTIYISKHMKRQLGWIAKKRKPTKEKPVQKGFNYILTVIDTF